MEAKSFVKLLRKVIREEVRSAVKSILSEQTINHKQVISHGMNLNDILNETAYTADFASMRQGPMVTQNGYAQTSQTLATTGINGEAIDMSNENVAKTLDVMTRDYSGLMKAIDKKKGR